MVFDKVNVLPTITFAVYISYSVTLQIIINRTTVEVINWGSIVLFERKLARLALVLCSCLNLLIVDKMAFLNVPNRFIANENMLHQTRGPSIYLSLSLMQSAIVSLQTTAQKLQLFKEHCGTYIHRG